MTAPYPLRLEPFFRDYLWGGRRLETVLGKKLPADGVWAESWEIVDHPEHSSRIENGPLAGASLAEVTAEHRRWLLGESLPQPALPLLLKYLDCQRVLSVQVHPDDSYAMRMSPPDLGKTEAWVVIAAEPDAVLYAGLKRGVSRQDLLEALADGQVEHCLHASHPQPGDCVHIPAGTVHALGGGLLVAEIQQASNTTFRLFDWNRTDASGRPRPLHLEQALEVIDFESGPRPLQVPQPTGLTGRERLVACDKFVLDRLQHLPPQTATGPVEPCLPLAADGRPHLLTILAGEARLQWRDQMDTATTGQSLLVPAAMRDLVVELTPGTLLLDMFPPEA